MKALRSLETIALTRITMKNMKEEKAEEIADGSTTEEEWTEEFKMYEKKLAKAVKDANREELELFAQGRYFQADDGNYYESSETYV